jgi:hypothetical protein
MASTVITKSRSHHIVPPKRRRSPHITYSISLARVIPSPPDGNGSNSGTVSLIEMGDRIYPHTPLSKDKIVDPFVPAVSRVVVLV